MPSSKLQWFLAVTVLLNLVFGLYIVATRPVAVEGPTPVVYLLLVIPAAVALVALVLFVRRSATWLYLCAAFYALQLVTTRPIGFTWGVGFRFRLNADVLNPIELNVTAAVFLVLALIAIYQSRAPRRA
jgi:hypothetical protein